MSESSNELENGDGPPNAETVYSVFHHLAAPKLAAYRTVLQIFAQARERFEISMRPADVLTLALDQENCPEELRNEGGVSACLEALRGWGNLVATRDVVSARTIEEYLHPRYLYQLTQAGEQAERALASFEQNLAAPGKLSTIALKEIVETLDELLIILANPQFDESKAVSALERLISRFDMLVEQAQVFMGGLQRELDRPGADETAFLALKEELLRYLENFVRELISSTYRIRHSLDRFSSDQVEKMLHFCVRHELAEAVAVTEMMRERSQQRWQARWSGLCGWFIGSAEHPSQSERLRQRAVEAIPALLERVRRMHDHRANRADRSTDFLTLARWFAAAPDEGAMHQLWRAAFALNPSRHLRVNASTLQEWAALDDGARPTWEDAPPYIIAISQWTRGSSVRLGKAPAIIDRSAAREALRKRADEESRALRAARQALANRTPCLLSDLPELDTPGFEVLLDAISEAFAHMGPGDLTGEATTADGGVTVMIELPVRREEWTTLSTCEGTLRGPNLSLKLRLTDDPLTIDSHAH